MSRPLPHLPLPRIRQEALGLRQAKVPKVNTTLRQAREEFQNVPHFPQNIHHFLQTRMAEQQPPNLVEGATSGDIEDEVLPTAKSAEDRKAAAALSKLDARGDDDGPGREIDQEAVKNAMSSLDNKKGVEKKEVKKVKVDAADVALLVRSRPGTK